MASPVPDISAWAISGVVPPTVDSATLYEIASAPLRTLVGNSAGSAAGVVLSKHSSISPISSTPMKTNGKKPPKPISKNAGTDATTSSPQPVHMIGLTPMRSDNMATNTTAAIRIANVTTIITSPAVLPTCTTTLRYVGKYPVSMKSGAWEVTTRAAQITMGFHCSTTVFRNCCQPRSTGVLLLTCS